MPRLKSAQEVIALQDKLKAKSEQKPVTVMISSGTCGQACGSLNLINTFRNELKKHKLENRTKLRITGCHGFCEQEPLIVIEPDNIFYCRV